MAIQQVFYAAYEAVHWLERLPEPQSPLLGPALYVHEPAWSLCYDRDQACMHLAAYDVADLAYVRRRLEQLRPVHDAVPSLTMGHITEQVTDYRANVERVKAYIRAGDVFQANIARFWQTTLTANQLPALYARLRRCNPAPFAAFFRAGPLTILSSSPERLFHIHDGWLNTRPIAGTRRRGQGADDEAMRAELLLSAKEVAEHIMLVDLERNDLGRVCLPGSIEVNELMTIERYATVQHIVSNVRGRLPVDTDVVDVFRALFPGGTITGCPKVRCMEIIRELEPRPREVYTGTLGYVTAQGEVDCNILIRSFWHHDGQLNWAAGAGIVADSDPNREFQETHHKAEGLMRALR